MMNIFSMNSLVMLDKVSKICCKNVIRRPTRARPGQSHGQSGTPNRKVRNPAQIKRRRTAYGGRHSLPRLSHSQGRRDQWRTCCDSDTDRVFSKQTGTWLKVTTQAVIEGELSKHADDQNFADIAFAIAADLCEYSAQEAAL